MTLELVLMCGGNMAVLLADTHSGSTHATR